MPSAVEAQRIRITNHTDRERRLRLVDALDSSSNSVMDKVYAMQGGRVEACEFVARENAPFLNTPLSSLSMKKGVLVSVIVRNRQVIIPFGSDCIQAGDRVILTARAGSISVLEDAFEKR